jgi:hypothetical protein
MGKHRPVHRGNPGEQRHAVALHQPQRVARRETGEQDERGPAVQAPIHLHGLTERVEQRQRHEVHVVVGRRVHEVRQPGVEHHVEVGQLSTLRPARRAARVEDHRSVLRAGRHGLEGLGLPLDSDRPGLQAEEMLAAGDLPEGLLAHRAHRQLGSASKAEVCLGVRVLEVICDLAWLEQHVKRRIL